MICSFKHLLLVFLPAFNHSVLAHHTLWNRGPRPYVISVSNISAASFLPHSNFSISTPRSVSHNHTQTVAGASTALPAKGAVGKVNSTIIDDRCLLWDPSCSGNRTLAIDKFFDPTFQHDLLSNRCFVQAGSVNLVNDSNCDKNNSMGGMSEFQEMKNWMRSQQCASAATDWAANNTSGEDPDSKEAVLMDPYQYHIASGNMPSCCGVCETNVQNVDIYYWPEPDVNTSCLSVIGDSVRPVDFGGTTTVWNVGTDTSTDIYWGCQPKTSVYYDTPLQKSVTDTDPIRTAMIRTIGSLLVKVYLSDPWSASPCTESNVMSQGSNGSITVRDKHATVHPRGHTLIIPSSVRHNDSLPVTTMVSGNFTFTSPSVYANFHGIKATDQCGGILISSTMVAFAPGELATIAGPLGLDDGDNSWTTKSFNFNDLPCPPQSVMEANWYKPQPGEPYRPLIALPSRLKEMIPWLSHCQDELFTAYDPPSALTVGTALVPPNSNSKTYHWAPVPSPTPDPGARKTVGPEASVPVPASVPTLDQPKATVTAVSAPSKQKGSDPGPPLNDPATQESAISQPRPDQPVPNHDSQQDSDPKQGGDPNQSSDNGGSSGQKEDPKLDNDLNEVGKISGSNHNLIPVSQDPSTQTNEANPVNDFTEGQAKTINNQVVQPLSHGISIAGTTLTPGAQPITISGTPIQLGSSALVIGTSTEPFTPRISTLITTTIAGHAITAASNAIAVAGTTLTPGAAPITVSGTPIHFGSSALVVGTSTVPLVSPAPTQLITTIANRVITAAPNAVAIAGTTLDPEAPGATIDGTALSLDKAGQFVIGSKTIPLVASEVPKTITTIIAGQAITAAPNAIALAGATLSPGSPGTTLDGTFLSLNAASQLLVGSQTVPLSSSVPISITTTIGGQVITAAPSGIEIASTALTPGASGVIVGGTPISLNTAGQLVIDSSKTIPLQSESTGLILGLPGSVGGAPSSSEKAADPLITTLDDGQAITVDPTALAMAGTTLTPGAAGLTFDGTVVSLNTAAELVVGSKTIPLGESTGSSGGETAQSENFTIAVFKSKGPFEIGPPVPTQTMGNGSNNSTTTAGSVDGNPGVHVFQGSALKLSGCLSSTLVVVLATMACIG